MKLALAQRLVLLFSAAALMLTLLMVWGQMRGGLFSEIRTPLAWLLLIGVIGILLASVPAAYLIHPLKRLTEVARQLAQGNYAVDWPPPSRGEIGQLNQAFQDMAGQLRHRDLVLRHTVARLEALLRTAADGILTFNERGIIEDFNQAAERMFGYRAEEIKGQQVQQLMELEALPLVGDPGPQDTPSMMFVSAVINTPSVIRRGRRRDGSHFWMEAAFSKVPTINRVSIMAIFRDVTRRVEDQDKIRQMTESLEERVRLRTAELEDAKVKLELALQAARSANRAKDEFVRTVSHELRTPLSAVKGYTELLLNPKAVHLRENPIPTLEKIHRASDYLLTLINDLLDVARASAGRPIELNIAPFEVEKLLAGLFEMTGPLVKKNGNRFLRKLQPPLGTMCSDETRVRQILLNLLSNACKFTEKGEIHFQAERPSLEGRDYLIFTVTDTGCGMTPEQLANLFQPFYRVDNSTSRSSSGTGLGLSITKILCQRMGGSVKVASAPGRGTTFVVQLPAETPEETTGFPAAKELAQEAEGKTNPSGESSPESAATGNQGGGA